VIDRVLLAALALATTPVGAQSVARREPSIAITHVSVVDVERGRTLADRTVLISDGRIVEVGPSTAVRVPRDARTLDGRGRWLIPGLWDMHVHTTGPESERLLPVYVAYGVTGVRDMGADLDVLRRARARILAGQAIGPRIVMAGPILDGPLGVPMPPAHRRFRIELTDPVRARRVVDSIARAGADFIKVHERVSPDVYRAIADEARRVGLRFAGHLPTSVGPDDALVAGQRSIEHLVNVPFACTEEETESLRPRHPLEALFGRCSAVDPSSLYRSFAASSVWHTPTLVVQRAIALRPDTAPGDPGTRHIPAPVRAMLHEVGPFSGPLPPADVRRRLHALMDKRLQQVAALHRAGVPLLVGSDAPGVAPGWSAHEEMRLLVLAGLPPSAALRAATLEPARWLGATDSLGTIARGRRADVVLLDADPLADIRNTRRIRAVIADGRLLERAALDQILADAARRAIPSSGRR
jgi:imidazolonepropionase-like amidohydrolase